MPEVTRLLDLVTAQPGAVVSRTLIKKKAGTVTLFAFDAGEGLSEHTAPYEAVVVILDGQAEVSVEDVPHEVGAGQMITLPASRPHALRAITPFSMMLIMIRE